jgi:hypothetical protein
MSGSASFVHLHVHTEFSMLDGAARIGELLDETARMQMPAIAITDDEYAKLLNYLKAIKRDGTLIEGANKGQPVSPGGTLKPTIQPTTQPGNSPNGSATNPPLAPGKSQKPDSTTTP